MKRCIQCDFVYEDDQVLCDMDGSDLASEPTLHPFERNAAPETGGGSARSQWKSIAALPAIVLIVGAVLFVDNYSAHRPTPQVSSQPATVVVEPATPNPVVEAPVVESPITEPEVVETRPSKQQPPQIPANNVKANKGAAPIPKGSPARMRPATPRRAERKPSPAKANHKKESKISGLLKKTGRLIKRPFKL